MCGILGYKSKGDNAKIQLRGQDGTTTLEAGGYTFVHNLLSVTGEYTPQPFRDKDVIALYNGEIYNLPFKRSDGENIIPYYRKYGWKFAQYFEGEWAIALFDFKNKIAVFATDVFATKPLWRKGTEFASYESGVGGLKIPANTIQMVTLDGVILDEASVYDFDFSQHKTSYADWIKAFDNSVRKRGKPSCFLGLSSGYDSGGIQGALRKLGIPHKSFAVGRNENEEIMARRQPDETINLTEEEKNELLEYIEDYTEDFNYTIKYYGEETTQTVHSDPASVGLAAICRKAQREGRKVYLSGQGADEIMSDYCLFPGQGEIGEFSKDLKKPWYNFYQGCQESYIAKEEHVAGTFNIETRYPYLDKQVVQEFLWLTPELKNQYYKAPLHEYLTTNQIPFEPNVKRGFAP